MNPQVIGEEINKALKKNLESSIVDFKPSSLWYQIAHEEMNNVSVLDLNLTVDELFEYAEKIRLSLPLNYYEFAGMNNRLQGKSAKQLDMNFGLYITLQREVDTLAKIWNDQTTNRRQDVVGKVMDKYKTATSN